MAVSPGSCGGGEGAVQAGGVVRGGTRGAEEVSAVEPAERPERDLCHGLHHRRLHRPGAGRGPAAGLRALRVGGPGHRAWLEGSRVSAALRPPGGQGLPVPAQSGDRRSFLSSRVFVVDFPLF